MAVYTLNVYPTTYKHVDGTYLLRHNWSKDDGTSQHDVPAPPILEAKKDRFAVVLNYGDFPLITAPMLELTGNPPVDLEELPNKGTQRVQGQTHYGGSGEAWTPAKEGDFVFNVLIMALFEGAERVYKADPEMVVSNNSGGGNPWSRG